MEIIGFLDFGNHKLEQGGIAILCHRKPRKLFSEFEAHKEKGVSYSETEVHGVYDVHISPMVTVRVIVLRELDDDYWFFRSMSKRPLEKDVKHCFDILTKDQDETGQDKEEEEKYRILCEEWLKFAYSANSEVVNNIIKKDVRATMKWDEMIEEKIRIQLKAKDAKIEEQGAQLEEKDAKIEEQGAQLEEKDAKIEEQGAQLEALTNLIKKMPESFRAQMMSFPMPSDVKNILEVRLGTEG